MTSDLTTISGIQVYLQDKPQFATHTIEKLSGGMVNFIYRLYLLKAFDGCQTVVLKYAAPYFVTPAGERYPMDQKRQLIEVQAIRLASQLTALNVPAFIKVPTIHLFDEENHVIIMDDAGKECQTLREILLEEALPKTVSEQIGTALGEFISGVHTWHQNPDLDLTLFANNQVGKDVWIYASYGRVVSTLTGRDNIATLSDPLLGIPESKMMTVSKVVEKRQQTIYAAAASGPIMHADFWPANLMISLKRGTDGTIEGVEKLYVLDWELTTTGWPGLELGQFCAGMYIMSEFYPDRWESTRAIIGSFLGAYRERVGSGEDIELAKMVVGHIGAYTVVWAPRDSICSGREKIREMVEKGVDMLILGEEGSTSTLRTSIVAPLL